MPFESTSREILLACLAEIDRCVIHQRRLCNIQYIFINEVRRSAEVIFRAQVPWGERAAIFCWSSRRALRMGAERRGLPGGFTPIVQMAARNVYYCLRILHRRHLGPQSKRAHAHYMYTTLHSTVLNINQAHGSLLEPKYLSFPL